MLLGGLVLDARQLEQSVEHPAVEDCLVVGAQAPGFTVLGNSQTQVPQHGPAASAREGVQAQGQAAAVVDDADGGMGGVLGVGEERHVHGPGVVHIHGAGLGCSNLAAQSGNLVLVAGDQLGDKGFAYAQTRMQAVEGAGCCTATSTRHVGFETQDLTAQPVGFAAVQGRNAWNAGLGAVSEGGRCWPWHQAQDKQHHKAQNGAK